MNKSNEQIKYVVTEGGEVFGVEIRPARRGERYLFTGRAEVASASTTVHIPVLTELDTPPVVERGVVEPLFAAAKWARLLTGNVSPNDMAAQTSDLRGDAVYKLNDALDQSLAATEEALNPKPRERYETETDEDGNWSVFDTQGDKFVAQAATAGDAEAFAEALNAQVGEVA